jgi:murein DD-endopeptidase MepM/ murein hydrolase activator NlpD
MTQRIHQTPDLFHHWSRFSLVGKTVPWMYALSLLSSGTAVAQTLPAEALAPTDAIAPIQAEFTPGPPSTQNPITTESSSVPEPNLPASSVDSSSTYIDSTAYSIGATSREDPAIAAQPNRSDSVMTNTAIPEGHFSSNSEPPIISRNQAYSIGTASFGQTDRNRKFSFPFWKNSRIGLIFPVSIPAAITSAFGWRIHPITGNSRFHSGTDIGAPLGTPVLAALAGKVAIADWLGGYGLAIAVENKNATQQTFYAHLSEIFVKPGQWVEQGEQIGRVGSTGNSTGPHLHFELQQATPDGWVAIDPGIQLEYALAQLLKMLQTAQATTRPRS